MDVLLVPAEAVRGELTVRGSGPTRVAALASARRMLDDLAAGLPVGVQLEPEQATDVPWRQPPYADDLRALDQALDRMSRQMRTAKVAVAMALAEEKRAAAKLVTERASHSDWQMKADLVRAGSNVALATAAQERADEHRTRADAMEFTARQQRGVVVELQAKLQSFNETIEGLKRRHRLFLARAARLDMVHASAAIETDASDMVRILDRLEASLSRGEAVYKSALRSGATVVNINDFRDGATPDESALAHVFVHTAVVARLDGAFWERTQLLAAIDDAVDDVVGRSDAAAAMLVRWARPVPIVLTPDAHREALLLALGPPDEATAAIVQSARNVMEVELRFEFAPRDVL